MQVKALTIPGLYLLTPEQFCDERGFFTETWNRKRMAEAGFDLDFVQDNHSMSVRTGSLRGLHFQAPPVAQAKLVRSSRGRIFDVAVDIRRGSPSFGRWMGVELSAETGDQLLIPRGFAHGFVTLEPRNELQYKVDAPYVPEAGMGIVWNDPDLAIAWPLEAEPVLSPKDAGLPRLAEIESPFIYEA